MRYWVRCQNQMPQAFPCRKSSEQKHNQIRQPFQGNRRKRESLRTKTQSNDAGFPRQQEEEGILRTKTQSNHAAFPRQQEQEEIPKNKNTIKSHSLSQATRGRGNPSEQKYNQITQPFTGNRRKRESLRTKIQSNLTALHRQQEEEGIPPNKNTIKSRSLSQATGGRGNPSKQKYNQISQPFPGNRRKRESLRRKIQSNHAAFPRQQEEEGIPPNKNTIKSHSLSQATGGRGNPSEQKYNRITQPYPGNERKREYH